MAPAPQRREPTGSPTAGCVSPCGCLLYRSPPPPAAALRGHPRGSGQARIWWKASLVRIRTFPCWRGPHRANSLLAVSSLRSHSSLSNRRLGGCVAVVSGGTGEGLRGWVGASPSPMRVVQLLTVGLRLLRLPTIQGRTQGVRFIEMRHRVW